jgi:hypothetical protein
MEGLFILMDKVLLIFCIKVINNLKLFKILQIGSKIDI